MGKKEPKGWVKLVEIKFTKANPKIIDEQLFEHINKPLWFPDNIRDSLRTNVLTKAPDMLQDVEIDRLPIPEYKYCPKVAGKTCGIFRSGGAGDLIMLEPIMRKMKQEGAKKIIVGCAPSYVSLMKLFPLVDLCIPFPIFPDVHNEIDFYLSFERTIEGCSKSARTQHGTDVFAYYSGVDLSDIDKKPQLSTNKIPEAVAKAETMIQEDKAYDKNIIAIQFRATNINRCFDVNKMIKVIAALAQYPNNHIYVLGGNHYEKVDGKIVKRRDCPIEFRHSPDSPKDHPRIHNLTGDVSWEVSAAIIENSDLVISPDSACLHIAGGLNIPAIGIFGPFPPEIRTKYYNDCYTIMSEADCAPCFSHGKFPCSHFGDNDSAPCWENIYARDIVRKAKDILEKG